MYMYIWAQACIITFLPQSLLQGIVALGAYTYLLKMDNRTELAKYYDRLAQDYVTFWIANAAVSNGIVYIGITIGYIYIYIYTYKYYIYIYNYACTPRYINIYYIYIHVYVIYIPYTEKFSW